MIRKLLLPALAAAILSSAACGDNPQVDIAASTATNTPTITPTPFVGEWERFRESADVLTGKELIGIALRSDASRQATLLVRCTFNSAIERENGLDALIAWDDDLGSDYRPTVALRFDDGDIWEDDWSLSTDSEATLAPAADAFISSMKGASRLVARVWKQDQTTITAQWDVAGFRDAVRPVEERCDPNFVPSPTPTPTPTPLTISDYLWRYETGDYVRSSPAIVDGVVYFGSVDNYLYAVDADSGELRWRYETGDSVDSSPAAVDGVVYFGSVDNYLYAVDAASGELRWRYETGDSVDSSPAAVDGVVYFGSTDNYLYAVDAASGELRWRYETEDAVVSSPVVVDGVVYFGSTDNYLYAVDAVTGTLRWRYETGDSVGSSPAVVDGIVYFGSTDDHLYAVDAVTGTLRWWYQTEHGVVSSPAVVDSIVYFSIGDYLYAVDAAVAR